MQAGILLIEYISKCRFVVNLTGSTNQTQWITALLQHVNVLASKAYRERSKSMPAPI